MIEHIIQFFAYEHLPEHLRIVSKPFCDLANEIVRNLPRNPERSVALRKLLESEGCRGACSIGEGHSMSSEEMLALATEFDAGPVFEVNGKPWCSEWSDADRYHFFIQRRRPGSWAIVEYSGFVMDRNGISSTSLSRPVEPRSSWR